MRRSSREGRYAERVLVGVDDGPVGSLVRRRAGAVWAVGRAVNLQVRESGEARAEDGVFEGYGLGGAVDRANGTVEDGVKGVGGDGRPSDARPFTRKEVL